MKRKSMSGAIEERFIACEKTACDAEEFLDYAGRPFAGAKGKKKRRPAPLGMTVVTVTLFVLLAVAACAVPSVNAQVTAQRLLDSAKEPQNWLMYSGDYAGRRFRQRGEVKHG